jgi:GTP-binding protein HflX
MADLKRTDLALRAERAILVQAAPYWDRYEADLTFEELENLARTAGAVIVGGLRQHLNKPHPRHYVGKGKLQELAALCESLKPDVVICDDELSPSQIRHLEASLDVKVVDRAEVILDIFARHASSKLARLQVELAQLEYEFPRLTRMWTHLDRTAGGTFGGPVGGGIGVRGPGERQLETDRRAVERRIYDLKKELDTIERQHRTAAEARHEKFAAVALVGYANAGKSSLLNALTGAQVSVRDRLFETLDTRTRRWELPGGQEVVLSDTVGFVRKFPHHLAASFHATLEEVREADLLLHVVDVSKHETEQEINAVNAVLDEVGCLHKPTVYLMNKVDLVDDFSEAAAVKNLVDDLICTSAVTGEGLDELRARVAEWAETRHQEFVVRAGVENGRLLSFLHDNGQVLEQRCQDASMEVRVRMDPRMVGVVRGMGGEVSQPPAHSLP